MEINWARAESGNVVKQKAAQKELDRKILFCVSHYTDADDIPRFFAALLPNLVTL